MKCPTGTETEHLKKYIKKKINKKYILKDIFKYYFLIKFLKFHFVFNKMSIIIEGKNISNNDDAEYVFEPTN